MNEIGKLREDAVRAVDWSDEATVGRTDAETPAVNVFQTNQRAVVVVVDHAAFDPDTHEPIAAVEAELRTRIADEVIGAMKASR